MEVFPLFPRARTQIAAQSLNVLVLLNEGCFQKDFLSLQWIAKLQLQADQNWHVLAVTEKMSIPLASWESLWVWSELSMIMEVVWSWFLFTLGGLDTRSVAERTSGWSGKGHSRCSKRGSIPSIVEDIPNLWMSTNNMYSNIGLCWLWEGLSKFCMTHQTLTTWLGKCWGCIYRNSQLKDARHWLCAGRADLGVGQHGEQPHPWEGSAWSEMWQTSGTAFVHPWKSSGLAAKPCQEKKKASEDVQTALSRPPVVEYWKGSDQAGAVLMRFFLLHSSMASG